MIRISKETIGGNVRKCSEDDANEVNIAEDIDDGHICCDGDECLLPEWAADDQ